MSSLIRTFQLRFTRSRINSGMNLEQNPAYFEAGTWARAWYLRAEEFITNRDALEFADILRAALPRLVTR